MYTENCTNCGYEVKFDAEVIRQDNPYWPWLDAKGLQDLTGEVKKLTTQLTNLNDTIRTPQAGLIAQIGELTDVIREPKAGLIAQIAELVKCFHVLLAPSPVAATATTEES